MQQSKWYVYHLNDELGRVKDDLRALKDEVGQVKARLSQMEGRSYNKLRYLPWHDITSIGMFRPSIGIENPEDFPTTIKGFWSLKFPRNGK